PGMHACTFGGNPLSAAAALATVSVITAPGFLENARAVGEYFFQRLRETATQHTGIAEVRGMGLMIGVELQEAVAPLVDKLLEAGIICGPAGPKVLRFVPPLIIGAEHVDRVIAVLSAALGELGW
ncbi:MAG TPA: aminotransferase class III-fold pyridoxal phosphate-dependent enzyme, partial [Candidatus Hydrogenedentes bacterium]|nr:aminotransferase class III-fold pyridoxal phosphate-dependent enzyme [Candidatus Hydrogenedentota bacterium]